MYRELLRRLFNRVALALRIKRHLTPEECYELLQFAEAIIEHGRMIQAYHGHSAPWVIVEIPEVARRFRETTRTVKDALLLLVDMGRAEQVHSREYWRLKLTAPLLSGHTMPWQGYEQLCIGKEKEDEKNA